MEHPLSREIKNEAELHVKKLQLHWLLQITKAINYNVPAAQLFEIYEIVMRDQLKVKKLVLFIHEHRWQKMLAYGVPDDFLLEDLETRFGELNELQLNNVHMPSWVHGFDSIIPVNHNEQALAYAFIGDLQNDEIPNLKEVLPFIHTITNIIVVAIENKRLTKNTIRQAQMQRELELAARMQTMLFPSHLPEDKKIDLAATYLPHQQVGGDYYDYIQLNKDELLICIADVSGKGISAALLMSNFQANLNAKAHHFDSLSSLLTELNESVNKSAKGEKFITAFVAVLNSKTHILKYVNAGQNPPFIYKNGEFKVLDKGTTGLGMFEDLPFIQEGMAYIHPNSILFCYTDGIVEQENERGDIFGLEILMDMIRENEDAYTMKDLHFRVLDTFNEFRKNTDAIDDVTLLSCRLLP
ncbi:MAG: PP2C family protein-serine/threonine phosphatase [Bacteroidia bacterium]|nr:PP2C family protein-serine/threonine phosphatase [Bacteroidia bacterium]